MPEVKEAQNLESIIKQDVWIIDDDIPGARELLGGDTLSGERPIDRGALRTLVSSEKWGDQPLQALCEKLVNEAGSVTAFRHPNDAILYLERGAPIPDVIIFDWEYRIDPMSPVELLKRLMEKCVSVVQVYTNRSVEEVNEHLGPLQKKYRARLEQARHKADTKIEQLIESVEKALKSSLSACLARKIRYVSSAAIEEVLVRIDNLPLTEAVKMLAGSAESPRDMELVEMLSVKVAEALESEPDLAAAVEGFVTESGYVPPDRTKEIVHEIVALLAAHVRNHIQYDDGLSKEIRLAWESATTATALKEDSETGRIVKDFFAFRLYDKPKDDFVRTGDIVELWTEGEKTEEPPDLYLLITPPCDLARFWSKTWGVLTFIRMDPIHLIQGETGLQEGRGLAKARGYGHSGDFGKFESITAKLPFVMPSVPIASGKQVDYALYVHEVRSIKLEESELVNAGKDNKGLGKSLTYNDLKPKIGIARKCRVSEPFLSGLLAKSSEILYRAGTPDYPEHERQRLKELFDKRTIQGRS